MSRVIALTELFAECLDGLGIFVEENLCLYLLVLVLMFLNVMTNLRAALVENR